MRESWLKRFIQKYRWSIGFALLLFLVFIFALHDHINILFSILNVIFIFLSLMLIGKIRNRFLKRFLVFVVSSLLSVNITFSVCFSAPLRLGNIASILETNFSEIYSTPIGIYLLGLICLLLTTISVIKIINEMNSGISARKLIVLLVSLVVLVNIVSVLAPICRNPSFFDGYKKDLREQPVQTIYAFSSLRLPLLYGDLFALVVYSYEKLDFKRFKNMRKKLPSGLSFENKKNSAQVIYLVIGESAYRGRMSLYGYDRRTTPFLDSIMQIDSSSILFYDGVAIANMTRDAIRFSLSFASPSNKNAFWEEKNVVEIAKDRGYNTIWISSQEQAGLYDNYPSYIARSSKSVFFQPKLKKDDLDLISVLRKYDEKEGKRFVVFHLIGSHFPYQERFDEIDNSYFEDKGYNSDDYDKSIFHTDRFLKELYNYTQKEDKNSIIVYYSDHGASPERGIHGLEQAGKSEYEIPFVLINNQSNIDADFIISKYYSGIEHKYINNLSLSYILAEFMGCSVDTESISSITKQGDRVMKVDGSLVDFERLYLFDHN